MSVLFRIARYAGNTFVLWVLLAAALGLWMPAMFKPLTAWIGPLLGVVMFGMGLTLTGADVVELRRRPLDVMLGTIGHSRSCPGWPGCWCGCSHCRIS